MTAELKVEYVLFDASGRRLGVRPSFDEAVLFGYDYKRSHPREKLRIVRTNNIDPDHHPEYLEEDWPPEAEVQWWVENRRK